MLHIRNEQNEKEKKNLSKFVSQSSNAQIIIEIPIFSRPPQQHGAHKKLLIKSHHELRKQNKFSIISISNICSRNYLLSMAILAEIYICFIFISVPFMSGIYGLVRGFLMMVK